MEITGIIKKSIPYKKEQVKAPGIPGKAWSFY